MKISLVLGNRGAIDRQAAQACVAMNLGLPGFGSILAGRVVGYAQAALTVAGFALTVVGALKLFVWFFANWSKINDPMADGWENLRALWMVARWPMLGMALFAASWLWALATSFMIMRSAPRQESARPTVK